jgi:midasin (ATPase involved in ribosome maturation)
MVLITLSNVLDAINACSYKVVFIIGNGNSVTAKEEVMAVRRKLSELENFVSSLINVVTAYRLHALLQECSVQKTNLKRLYGLLEQDGSLNCGGKFEWIDSILVKCLREGHWLLIDNVNFCRFVQNCAVLSVKG